MKRTDSDGNPADLVGEYRKADGAIEHMPRYATRAGRALLSRAEARTSKGARPLSQGDLLTTWEPVGPGNIGGRTRVLVIDPAQPQVMYAGGVSGGIRKTEDGDDSWRVLDVLLPNIAVNSMAMDPADSRIV